MQTRNVLTRAYALLHVKAVDEDQRVITGTATTPEPDRVGDIIEPLGASYKNPLPLLLHHDTKKPVGSVTLKKPTKAGIDFVAKLPAIAEPGVLKDRIDEAWQSVKAGLIAGVSVGFRGIETAFNESTGGLRFLQTEIIELSLVTVPANASATIASIKSLDQAASGPNLPGVTGALPIVRAEKKAAPSMTIQEQIASFEAQRAAKVAEMNTIMTGVAEKGETLDAEQTEKYDALQLEVKSIDAHLPRLRDLEKANVATATRITTQPTATTTTATEAEKAAMLRGGQNIPVITVKANVPKGTAFVRAAMALTGSNGDSYAALERAKSWTDTPEVEELVRFSLHQKAAVAAATTTTSGWASNLAIQQPTNEFLELLRPRTLLGRIPGFRQVPFNVSVPAQTGGGTYSWVGEGNAKPVTSGTLATVTVGYAKAAGIIVLTRELVMISSPSAEGVVREEMIAGIGAFLDTQLVDPTVAAVAGVNPASITNGAATAAASGATAAALRADLAARVATFTAANIPLDGSVWLMNDSNAFAAGISLNALGQPLFPGMSQQGGSILGIPVVVSNNVGNRIILVHAPSILYADEGGVQLDVSREASVQMDSAPSNPSDATTVLVSFWQRNLVGLRAERMINWTRARSAAVTYISAAAYTGA